MPLPERFLVGERCFGALCSGQLFAVVGGAHRCLLVSRRAGRGCDARQSGTAGSHRPEPYLRERSRANRGVIESGGNQAPKAGGIMATTLRARDIMSAGV